MKKLVYIGRDRLWVAYERRADGWAVSYHRDPLEALRRLMPNWPAIANVRALSGERGA